MEPPESRPLLDAFLWFLVLVMLVVVVHTSLKTPADEGFPISDKILHFLAYTGLTTSILLAAVWAPLRGEGRFRDAPGPITLVAFSVGVAVEVVQGPLPERDADLVDAIANGAGAVTALAAWRMLRTASTPSRRGN